VSTAIIIDPALKNYAGHHFTAVTGWVEASQTSGCDVRVLAHRECIAEAAGPASIEKVFQGEFYGVAPTNRNEAWKRLRAMQRGFRDDLSKPLMQIQSRDVIVLAHSTLVTLNGIAAWAGGMPRQRLPRLVAWLMFKPEAEDFVAPLGSQDCLVAAIDRLRALFGDRLILAGSTRAICRRWEALGGGAVHFLPFTALRASLCMRKERSAPARPLIVAAGHLGTRKGTNFIPALIKELHRRQMPVRWRIAGSDFEGGSPVFAEIARLAQSEPHVSLVTDAQGLMEYDNVLETADLAILPYSPEDYKERGSGVAEEAELIGLPYVAPNVEFSAEAVSAGAAVSFDEWTVQGISSALVAAVSKLPELSSAAVDHARRSQEQLREIREELLPLIFRREQQDSQGAVAVVDPLPGVDIIVTLHNYRRFLRQCLKSVSRQSYPNWRCIVVDDGSTDITFGELRTLVASFGEKFTYESHATAGGQLKAIATGLSLGSHPFVLMLDVDDCLTSDALDIHLSWHLNTRVPAAFTSGRVQVVDELGRLLSGCIDNAIWLDYAGLATELPRADVHRRPGIEFEPPSASFVRQNAITTGQWPWSPTSATMFRRSMMELVLPDHIEIGAYAGDTYFVFAAQAMGGSILIDRQVALYRRHGGNGHSDMAVYGAGTMAARSSSSNSAEAAMVLKGHIQSNPSRFFHQIRRTHVDRFLAHMTSLKPTRHVLATVEHPPAATLNGIVAKKTKKIKRRHKVRREIRRIGGQLKWVVGRPAAMIAAGIPHRRARPDEA
jgi:hypothetical protein